MISLVYKIEQHKNTKE